MIMLSSTSQDRGLARVLLLAFRASEMDRREMINDEPSAPKICTCKEETREPGKK